MALYRYYVTGNAICGNGKETTLSYFGEHPEAAESDKDLFFFDIETDQVGRARQVIQSTLIDAELRKRVSGFKRVRECQIVHHEPIAESSKKVDTKLAKLVAKASDMGCMPINFKALRSDKDRIKALEDAIKRVEDAKERKKNKGKKKELEQVTEVFDDGFVD